MTLKEIYSKINANDDASLKYKSLLTKQNHRSGQTFGKGDVDYGVEVFVVRLMNDFILENISYLMKKENRDSLCAHLENNGVNEPKFDGYFSKKLYSTLKTYDKKYEEESEKE